MTQVFAVLYCVVLSHLRRQLCLDNLILVLFGYPELQGKDPGSFIVDPKNGVLNEVSLFHQGICRGGPPTAGSEMEGS